MYKPVKVIEVRIWGKKVGAVALDLNLGYYVFEYEPAFVKTGIELAPRAMPLAEASGPFVFTDLPDKTYKRLPALLADALPDDFGNALIDAWMATQGVERESITTLDRLAYIWVAHLNLAQAQAIFRRQVKIDAAARKQRQKEHPAKPEIDTPEEAGISLSVDFRDQLLATIQALPSGGFERLCQRLLREAGFQQVTVTGKSLTASNQGRSGWTLYSSSDNILNAV